MKKEKLLDGEKVDKYVRKLQLVELDILKEVDKLCKKNDIKYFLCGGTLLGAIRHGGFIPWDDDIDIAMTRDNYQKFVKVCQKELNEKYFLDCYETNKKFCLPYAKVKLKNTLYVENKNQDFYDEKSCIWIDIFPLDAVEKPLSKGHYFRYKMFNYLTTLITIKNGSNYYQNSVIKKKIYHAILLLVPMKLLIFIYHKIVGKYDLNKTKYLSSFATVYTIEKETYETNKLFPYSEIEFEGIKFMGIKGYDYYLSKMYKDYMQLPPKEKRVNHKPYIVRFPDGEELHFDNQNK